MEERNLAEHLLKVRFGLLRTLAQGFDRPSFALLESLEELVEELVARHAGHALELTLGRLGFGALLATRRVR